MTPATPLRLLQRRLLHLRQISRPRQPKKLRQLRRQLAGREDLCWKWKKEYFNRKKIANCLGITLEELFQTSLQPTLNNVFPNKFFVDRHPKEFSNIYSDYPLPQNVLNEIYNVDVNKKSWGISMNFSIRNLQNHKTLFGEIKRQDGWVENTDMQSGRGNAHERSLKK